MFWKTLFSVLLCVYAFEAPQESRDIVAQLLLPSKRPITHALSPGLRGVVHLQDARAKECGEIGPLDIQ